MFYKLSNSVTKKQLEHEIGMPFEHPNIYCPNPIVDGLKETTLPIIIAEKPKVISHGIWGILPKEYEGSWEDFQNVYNTLNFTASEIKTNSIYSHAYQNRRCLIIVDGFFTSYYMHKKMYPIYVFNSTKKPFFIAGIYNKLSDGFITCSLLLKKATSFISKIQNLTSLMPAIIDPQFKDEWLNSNTDLKEIDHILQQQSEITLKAHPIARDFYEQGIIYESILDPVYYNQELIFD
ncbi:SOS response-associated peptidase family protein [Aquimarina brevivitae]|uniref:Abasic site processing protein n=1 Tax=Aquimarina brevivitae TaxID=323412 RepID=A0A4Q7PJN5_9FLAO|nr:SOS response-associated peptidase family protein [Aquimarina brevivitae]RZT00041.1 putative SOS response-associated peptidase YedK [Aquimarina brevivitae]